MMLKLKASTIIKFLYGLPCTKLMKLLQQNDTIILTVGVTDKVVPQAETGVESLASSEVKSIDFQNLS